jgi:hypothetical protein
MITHNNYEAYLLDYFEANLSHELVEELLAFINVNEDVKNAIGKLSAPGDLVLDIPPAAYPNKKSLKKTALINDENYLNYLVALVENDLNLTERKEVKSYIAANPQLQSELALLKRSKLDSADVVAYPYKSKLKKDRFIIPFYYPIAAAASIILMFGVYYFNENKNDVGAIAKAETHKLADTLNIIQPIIPAIQKVAINKKQVQYNPVKEKLIERESIAYADIIFIKTIEKTAVYIDKITFVEVPFSNQNTDVVLKDEPVENASLKEIATKKIEKVIDKAPNVIALIDSAKKSGLLNIANAGLNTFGRLTGTDLRIERRTDANGNYKGITFAAAGFELSHTKGAK